MCMYTKSLNFHLSFYLCTLPDFSINCCWVLHRHFLFSIFAFLFAFAFHNSDINHKIIFNIAEWGQFKKTHIISALKIQLLGWKKQETISTIKTLSGRQTNPFTFPVTKFSTWNVTACLALEMDACIWWLPWRLESVAVKLDIWGNDIKSNDLMPY